MSGDVPLLVQRSPSDTIARPSTITVAIDLRLTRAVATIDDRTLVLETTWLAPDRDTGEPVQIKQYTRRTLTVEDLHVVRAWLDVAASKLYPEVVHAVLREAANDIAAHELDERARVAGDRVVDPHAGEKEEYVDDEGRHGG